MENQAQVAIMDKIREIRNVNFKRGYAKALIILVNRFSGRQVTTWEFYKEVDKLIDEADNICEEEFKDG